MFETQYYFHAVNFLQWLHAAGGERVIKNYSTAKRQYVINIANNRIRDEPYDYETWLLTESGRGYLTAKARRKLCT